MSSYFDDLQKQIEKYQSKYPGKPQKCALKLAWWSLKKSFKKGTTESSAPKDDFLKIAIAEGGGIGDSLFQITYIKEIRKLFSRPVIIDFYCRPYKAFQNIPFIDHCGPYDESHACRNNYDVYLISRRFYIIDKINEEKVKNFSLKFYDFCIDCRNLTDTVLKGEYHDNLFNQYALLFGKNRLEQANVHHLIPVDRHTPKFLSWCEADNAILYDLKLADQKYITICRAVDSKYDNGHPKLWPLAYYDTLIQKIKKAYPNIKIVQIGSDPSFGVMKGIDLNLVGKTTLNQSQVILKHSLLHIDGEGGLVHIKNALNGKSVVLFGPTNPDIFGYADNINLRSKACPFFCEWITSDWNKKCLKGYKVPPCMAKLSPDEVFGAVQKYLLGLAKYSVHHSQKIGPIKNKKTACIMRPDKAFLNRLQQGKNDITVYDTDLSLPDLNNPRNCDYYHQNQKRHITCEFGNAYNIPAADDTYDIVYCDRLNELKFQDLAVREMIRVVKNNSIVILSAKESKNGSSLIYITKRENR